MSTAIAIEHVSKAYRLGMIGGGTVGADLSRWWARVRRKPDPLLKIGQEHRARRIGELFWALNDISFQVKQGEVLGIIGRNGAGKSTLLKVLSQVTGPTSGQIKIWGRVASLLEVGTGFHPELTGRENIFLNGAILGMTKAEIRTKFEEIVEFSECREFIDTPVKRYSSGMYVRLAFAVAAHLEPEILIVDEVLAVGDAQFQKKCLGKMRDVSQHGRTVLFVSHTMPAVLALCDRAVLIRDGLVALDGDTSRVVEAYQADSPTLDTSEVSIAQMPRTGSGKARFSALTLSGIDKAGRPTQHAVPGSDLLVETEIECVTGFSSANVAVMIYDTRGYRVVDANTAIRGEFLSLNDGQRATVRFHLRDVLLKPGRYVCNLWLGRGGIEDIDHVENARSFEIHEDVSDARHSEVFPGVYQCRFSHELMVHQETGA